MVLKLHAKEGIKVHMTKLLAETIWRAKEVRKNIRKKNTINNGGQKRTSDQRMNLAQCVGPTCNRRVRSTCAKRKIKSTKTKRNQNIKKAKNQKAPATYQDP